MGLRSFVGCLLAVVIVAWGPMAEVMAQPADPAAPEAGAPEEAAPEEATPEEATPEEGAPEEAAPDEGVPEEGEPEGEVVVAKAGLRIHFVSTRSTYSAVAYDVFSVATGAVVASGKGAIESRGEIPETWELEPGLYKIVRAGEPFTTRTDFATAVVDEDAVTDFIIVVDDRTGAFRGSGPVTGELPEGVEIAGFRIALNGGGTVMFNQKYHSVGSNSGINAMLGLFGHFGLVVDSGSHFLDVTADLQLNIADTPTASAASTTDVLEASATYTYKINNPYIGPYVRAGFRTRVYPGYLYLDGASDTVTVNIARTDGTTDTDTYGGEANSDDLRVKISKPFAPFVFQEEVGANLKAVDLDFVLVKFVVGTRIGFGFRQGITNDLLVVDGDEEGNTVNLVEVGNYNTLGPVIGAGAQITVTRWLFGAADFGMMIPLTNTDDAGDNFGDRLLLDLSGTAGLKIPSITEMLFASFDYTLRLQRDGFMSSEVQFDHVLMARANLTLF